MSQRSDVSTAHLWWAEDPGGDNTNHSTFRGAPRWETSILRIKLIKLLFGGFAKFPGLDYSQWSMPIA